MFLLDGALQYSIVYSFMVDTVKPGFPDIMVIATIIAHTYEPLLSILLFYSLDIHAIFQIKTLWGSVFLT